MTIRLMPDDYPYKGFGRRALALDTEMDKPKKARPADEEPDEAGYGKSEDLSNFYWRGFDEWKDANLVTSALVPLTFLHPGVLSKRLHSPAIDIDYPMSLVEADGDLPDILFFGKSLSDDSIEEAAAALAICGVVDGDTYSIFDRPGDTGVSLVKGARFQIQVKQSTNPLHSHLFIDSEVSHHKYVGTTEKHETVLSLLAAAGVVEAGYAKASRQRGCSALRLGPKPDILMK